MSLAVAASRTRRVPRETPSSRRSVSVRYGSARTSTSFSMKAPAYFPSPSRSNQFSIETLMPRVCTQWGPRFQTAPVLGWAAVAPSCPGADTLGRGRGDVLVDAGAVLGVILTRHRGDDHKD